MTKGRNKWGLRVQLSAFQVIAHLPVPYISVFFSGFLFSATLGHIQPIFKFNLYFASFFTHSKFNHNLFHFCKIILPINRQIESWVPLCNFFSTFCLSGNNKKQWTHWFYSDKADAGLFINGHLLATKGRFIVYFLWITLSNIIFLRYLDTIVGEKFKRTRCCFKPILSK